MMKKKKPLLILLGILLIILIALFFIFSGKPQEGDEGIGGTLRRFFNFGIRTTQEGEGGETGGDLLNNGINPLTGREYTDEELRILRQEQDRLNREQQTTFSGQQPINPFTPGTNPFNTPTTTGGQQNRPTTSTSPTQPPSQNTQGPICSDIDLYITFTPEEQAEIAKLQQRFNAIAVNLASDQDVETEEVSYSNFKIRTERFNELTTMCKNTIEKAATSPYATLRVPTPFWRDTNAQQSFLGQYLERRQGTATQPGRENDPACSGGLCVISTFIYSLPRIDSSIEKIDPNGNGIPYNWFEVLYRLYIW